MSVGLDNREEAARFSLKPELLSGFFDSRCYVENLVENLLLVAAAVFIIWGIGLFIVAYTAATTGASAHEENRRLASGGIRSALRGELALDNGRDEPRTNHGLALDLRTRRLISQGKLSEEATDEVIGVKV